VFGLQSRDASQQDTYLVVGVRETPGAFAGFGWTARPAPAAAQLPVNAVLHKSTAAAFACFG
jgi:hypothetical protein